MKRLILVSLAVCVFFALVSGCGRQPTPSPAAKKKITVIDNTGSALQVSAPVERIVSLNSGMSALLCAFGAGGKIVGRDSFSTFPSSLQKVPIIGESSAIANIEMILDKTPDVVVADTMFKADLKEKLTAAGVPVVIDSTSNPDRIVPIIQNIGLLLDERGKAEEMTKYIESYTSTVASRIAALKLNNKPLPLVFFQWGGLYRSASAETLFHKPIVAAGGINIAAEEPVPYPRLSAEWVLRKNPDIIIHRVSGDENMEAMKQIRDDIVSQPGLSGVKAVKEGKVYIIKADVFLTLRYPVGLLYYAKWFHPDEFRDIDPAAVHRELIQRFFGAEEWQRINESFVFPQP